MRLLRASAKVFFTLWDRIHIAAPSRILLASQVSLDVAINPMAKIGSFGSKRRAFICDLALFTGFAMETDTVSS